MAIFALKERIPSMSSSSWVHENAVVIGSVLLHADVSVWPGAVLRGDLAPISIAQGSNIQDNAVLHTNLDAPCTVGRNVTIGHCAVLHGCTIGDGCLIGMGAIILNHAVIAENCLVGAGALVTEGKHFPASSLIVGSPARCLRQLTAEELEALAGNAAHYRQNALLYREHARPIEPNQCTPL